MTVAELCAWGKASILVPLPTAARIIRRSTREPWRTRRERHDARERALSRTVFKTVTALAHERARLDELGRSAQKRVTECRPNHLEKVLELSQVE